MYLIGIFERDSYGVTPMWQAKAVSKVTREHLIKAKADKNYQVINLVDKTYYSPETNDWVKFESNE